MTIKTQSEIRNLFGYALCQRLREEAEGIGCELHAELMRRAADEIETLFKQSKKDGKRFQDLVDFDLHFGVLQSE